MDTKKVLVCDDEIDSHLFIEAALERYKHFKIIDAWNGKQAVEIVKSSRPDVIIMDFKMPVMDGFEALKEIGKIASIPAIMLTGINMDPGTRQELEPSIVEYLVKPFENSELLNALKKVFKELER